MYAEVDKEYALDLYKASADKGYAPAQYTLGREYADVQEDLGATTRLWIQAANQGHPRAIISLPHHIDRIIHYNNCKLKSLQDNCWVLAEGRGLDLTEIPEIIQRLREQPPGSLSNWTYRDESGSCEIQ